MASSPALLEDPWRDLGIAMEQFYFPDGKNKARASRIRKERESRFEEWERLDALKKKRKTDEALRKTAEEHEKAEGAKAGVAG